MENYTLTSYKKYYDCSEDEADDEDEKTNYDFVFEVKTNDSNLMIASFCVGYELKHNLNFKKLTEKLYDNIDLDVDFGASNAYTAMTKKKDVLTFHASNFGEGDAELKIYLKINDSVQSAFNQIFY
jgi:hypothetical protein